jgi:hypothetical protein
VANPGQLKFPSHEAELDSLGFKGLKMNCYQCGADVGESLGLCAPCQKARMGEPLPEMHSRSNENIEALGNFFCSWPGRIVLILVLAVIAFIFLTLFLPKLKIEAICMLSMAILFGLASTYGWAKMWSELLVNEPALAVLAFLFPPLVYRCVASYPELLLKPFALHIGAGLIAWIMTVTALGITS